LYTPVVQYDLPINYITITTTTLSVHIVLAQ